MALISRSAEETFFNSLPSELHDDLIKNFYDQNEAEFLFLTSFFNFSLGVVGKRYLISRGIRLSPIGGVVSHSHPICKSIENHILYVVMPQLLSKSKRFALMSIKENKAKYLFKRNEMLMDNNTSSKLPLNRTGVNEFHKIVNRVFEPKDILRYNDITLVNCPYDNKSWFKVVGNLLGPKSGVDNIFIHDEVHHWSESDMAAFLISTEVETLVFTVVFPPEIIRGERSSMNPDIYSFSDQGDEIFFFPDSANIIPYQQSKKKGLWLLTAGRMGVTFKNGQRELYSFQMIENHGAHSLFICTRRKVQTEKKRFFKDFSGSDLSQVSKESVILKDRIREKGMYCSHELLEKVINYIVCLKKPDVESALAKLRQLTDSTCHPDEVFLLHNIIASFISCKDFFEKGILSFVSLSVRSALDMALQLAPEVERILGPTNLSKWMFLRSLFLNLKRFEVVVDTLFIDGDLEIKKQRDVSLDESYRHQASCLVTGVRDDLITLVSQGLNKVHRRDTTYSSVKHPFLIEIFSENGISNVSYDNSLHLLDANENLRMDVRGRKESLIYCLVLKCRKVSWIKGFICQGDVSLEEVKMREEEQELTEIKLKEELQPASRDHRNFHSLDQDVEGVYNDLPDNKRKNSCFIRSISAEINLHPDIIISKILSNRLTAPVSLIFSIENDLPISIKDVDYISKMLDLRVTILDGEGVIQVGMDDEDKRSVTICKRRGHAFNLPGSALSKEKFLSGLAWKVSDFFFSTSSNPEFFNSFDLSIDLKSASILVDSLFHNDFGALLDRSKIKKGGLLNGRLGDPSNLLQNLRKAGKDFRILTKASVLPILGFAGSGKTSSLLRILHDSNLRDFEWISPRSELLKDLRFGNEQAKELKNFSTFEIGLSRSKDFNKLDNIIIVLDEVFLLPNGFIDFLVLNVLISSIIEENLEKGGLIKQKGRELEEIILQTLNNGAFSRIGPEILIIALGDPLQTKFFSQDAPSLNRARSFREIIGGAEEKNYLNFSKRFGSFLNNSFSLANCDEGEGKELDFKVISSLESIKVESDSFGVLVASQEDKRKYSFNFDSISTIGEAQGRTFDETLLILTRSIYKADKETIITAITRARNRVWIWVPKDMEGHLRGQGEGSILLNNLLAKNSDAISEIISSMKTGLRLFSHTERLGSDFELKTEGDLFLRAGLSLLNRKDMLFDDAVVEEAEPMESKMKVHISLSPQNFSSLENSEFMRAREYRELKEGSKWSEQFNDTFKMGGFNSESFNQSMSPSAVFPRHQSSDSVTFWAAVKKRLVFKDPYTNLRNVEKASSTGKTMLQVFLSHVNLKPDWDEGLYEGAKLEFEEKKISKSSSLIANHSIRSDSDWPKENFFLFMKNQSCKKLEKMFCDGKAGQTLACFSHSVLLRFGPLNRYIEKKVSEQLPSRFYIHQKKNFEDLEKWVIRESFDGECTESDYEAFDASQDHFALAFEIELMRFLQIPEDLIEDYKWLKCYTNCRLGNMAIMRFTGEFCTFMFNTLINMVFTFLAYDISDSSICFAGDDMCANRRLKKQNGYASVLENFSLKAKVDFTHYPSFCGWRLFKDGIVKSPTLVAARVEIAKQKTVGGQKGYTSNDIALVCDSYFLEVLFTYRKGDLIFGLLSEREMYHFYNVMRFFVKNKKYLSPSSRKLLESDKESGLYLGGEVGSVYLFEGFRECLDSNSIRNPSINQKKKDHLGYRSMCDNLNFGVKFKTKLEGNLGFSILNNLDLLKCQSSMEKNSWNSHLAQTKRFSLMGSILPTYTVMLEASRKRLQTLSRDSKSTSPFQLKDQKEQLQSIYHSLMMSKGKLFINKMMISAYYIIQRSFSLSLGFLTRLARLKGNLSSLMREQQELRQQLRKVSPLTLVRQTGPIIYTALIHSFQSLTPIFQKLSSFVLNSLGHISSQARIVSLSTLESCTGCLTTQMMVYAKSLSRTVNFKSSKQQIRFLIYKVQSTLISCVSMKIGTLKILERKELFQRRVVAFLGKRRGFLEYASTGLTQLLSKLGQLKSSLMKSFLDFLGQTLLESLQEFLQGYQKESFENFWQERLEKMSIKSILEKEMREGLQDYIWRNIIDAPNAMHMTPAVGTQLTQELAERKAFILRHFFRHLAGNLAVEGTSEQTKYPDHTIRLPPIPAARIGGTENLVIEMNMVEVIGAMRAWRDTLALTHPNRNATLRQMATPFADHALEFLVDHANEIKTNLASAHPELAKAPEVAFDFARGLSPRHTVNALRAQTIGAFTGRTFRTEGQKGVFTAQGTVNVSYDG